MTDKILVLAEKPSVGRELARVLNCHQKQNGYIEGNSYVVTWSLGHLVTLATPEEYDKKYTKWAMEDLPIIPKTFKLVIIPNTQKQFQTVSRLMKRSDISQLVIATDAGREGELVARWIMEKAGWRKETKRLWISSQTDGAIKEGFANLKPGQLFENLYASATARSQADWLIGFNISRALTCKYDASLSAGRVQTPTLAMIVAREEEIEKFVPQPYYTLTAHLPGFTAKYKGKQGSRISKEDEALAILTKCKTDPKALVSSMKKELKKEAPPMLFDLTELQREANRRFSFSAKETLDLTQRLYEEHKLLTYPRTDSRYLSTDLIATIPQRLQSLAVYGTYAKTAKALLSKPIVAQKRFFDDSKVTDHHAIIPTEQRPNFSALSNDERRIYDLITARFLGALSEDCLYDQTDIVLTIAGFSFTAKGKIIKSLGWRGITEDQYLNDEDEGDEDKEAEQKLPSLSLNQELPLQDIALGKHLTKAPKRYTEATLLTAMEKPGGLVQDQNLRNILQEAKGIGTPATRAEIIERILEANYAERKGKEFYPLSKGRQLLELVPSDLKSPVLTAQWEEKLTLIAQGKLKDKVFLKDLEEYTKKLVKDINTYQGTYRHDNLTKTRCPNCNEFMLEINTKRGKFLVCSKRECGYRQNISFSSNARCPVCHKKLEVFGEDDKRIYICKCGWREKFDRYNQQLAEKRTQAGRLDIQRYQKEQAQKEQEETESAFALAFKKAQKK